MEVHDFFIQLALILVFARLVGEAFSYLKLPSVVGELCAGILIGPSLLGWVEIAPSIHLLAQVGVILLLFEVGIETDVKRLTSASRKALIVAIGGAIFPFALGYYISYETFHFSLLTSLFIGSTLTATSIGITLRVLKDLKKQNSHEAQVILGAAIFDDVIGIILLALLYEFSLSGRVNFWMSLKVLVSVGLFLVLTPWIAKWASYGIKKWEEKSETSGFLPVCITSLILLFSWIAYKIGAPELLGGFAVGLAFSKKFLGASKFQEKVEKQMKPLVHLFTPIFFVSIGLSLDFRSFQWGSSLIWCLMSLLLLAAILGKVIAGFMLRGEKTASKFLIGTAMVPRGEIGLVFASMGLTAGAFSQDVYSSVVLVIALTTLLGPIFLRLISKP